jgi:hypothetical protein
MGAMRICKWKDLLNVDIKVALNRPYTFIVLALFILLITPAVLKAANASTIDVVNGIRKHLPRAETTLPPPLKIQPSGDQSISVRAAVSGMIREAVVAAC